MARRLSDVFNHSDDISPEDALRHCANYLGGPWTRLDVKNFKMEVVRSGFVNRIFICERTSRDDGPLELDAIRNSEGKSPTKALLRLYGGKLIDSDSVFRNGGEAEEVLVFHAMSQLGYGPRLYGVFAGGRVEEFIDCRLYSNEDFDSPDMEAAFARHLARMHVLKLPLTRRNGGPPSKIEAMLPNYVEVDREEIKNIEANASQAENKVKALNYDLVKEFDWLKSIRHRIKTRMVLVHGDMNRANCLVRNDRQSAIEKVVLIDYEFACYGDRGTDIGGHFYNRCFDVAKLDNKFISGLDYPNIAQRRHFVVNYLNEMSQLVDYELDESEDGVDCVDNVLMETEYCLLVLLIFFALLMLKDRKKFAEMGMSVLADPHEFLADFADKFYERKEEFLANFGSKL